jgi:hypothetical protein
MSNVTVTIILNIIIKDEIVPVLNCLKPSVNCCVPPALTGSNCAFSVYGSSTFLSINNDNFLKNITKLTFFVECGVFFEVRT